MPYTIYQSFINTNTHIAITEYHFIMPLYFDTLRRCPPALARRVRHVHVLYIDYLHAD